MPSVAIVTGATGGIGSAIAHHLWREKYSLIVLGKTQHKMDALLDILNDAKQAGQNVSGVCMDISKHYDWWRVQTLIETYEREGCPLTLLVCAHGTAPVVKPTTHLTTADMQRVWNVDVLGTLMCCQLVGRYMIEHTYGSIVLVSSAHAKMTYPERTLYSMAKSALGGMVRALALEWGCNGVRVNAICPWQCEGPRTEAFLAAARLNGEDLREQYLQRSPMRRLIQPEEVADAVLFLVRNDAMNGCELVMDGGVSQSMWYKPFLESSHVEPSTLSQS